MHLCQSSLVEDREQCLLVVSGYKSSNSCCILSGPDMIDYAGLCDLLHVGPVNPLVAIGAHFVLRHYENAVDVTGNSRPYAFHWLNAGRAPCAPARISNQAAAH